MIKNIPSTSRKVEKKPKPDVSGLAPKPFPIVGIGASAGGIKAFTTVLEHLRPDLGMAYVLVMHLSRNHKSALAEIMQSKTQMKVQTVNDGMEVMANNVYVIPPNTFMSLVDGHLKLAPRAITAIGNFAVDYFFTALAEIYKNNAVGIILSGTATDGTLGLKAIKAEGGITFAQDESAEFGGMPGHAYDSGYVDFRLSPENMARELEQLVKIPYSNFPSDKIERVRLKELSAQSGELQRILVILKKKVGIDFFQDYKHASIYRRILRRMALKRFTTLPEYCEMLKNDSAEVLALYDNLLINVTYFFRDPEFYNSLVKTVFPDLIKNASKTEPLRIWVAGCSTGEEAYSLAICLIEYLEDQELELPIQIFASDLDASAIEKARLGIYPVSGVIGVSPNYLKKYFVKSDGLFQIIKSVRQLCVFSQQNLLKDPPFSKMDLISCQNVLIYLESLAQEKILQTFHYALKSNGFLFLGKSEAIGSATEFFQALDKKVKIYSKKSTKAPQFQFTIDRSKSSSAHVSQFIIQRTEINVEKAINKLVLSRAVHPSIAVNKSLSIVHFFGNTSSYLLPVVGKASLNILKIIHEDLVLDLGNLLQQAKKSGKAVSKLITLPDKKTLKDTTIEVIPTWVLEEVYYLVVFKDHPALGPAAQQKRIKHGRGATTIISRLEEELSQSRSLIRASNEEYETSVEELQANSEEILSSNEELQSVNEELESSKEALQSAIEELTITNLELSTRNADLDQSQKSLKKVNEQLEQFAFISSHDLQEPLRKVQTFADRLLNDQSHLNDYAKQYAKKISASSAKMATLIRDLLSFAVLSRSEKRLESVDLSEVVKNVLDDFEISIEEKKASFKIGHLPVIQATRVQMNQLFHNLLSNALKFSKANPEITISSRSSNGEDFTKYPELDIAKRYVSISVSDNGIGFDNRFLDRIFTIFQKLDDKRGVEGTGIGLAVCKKIAEDHGGFIFGQGEKGRGATFTIFLPEH
jgi:two-component system, chemotaxis family, CheB/CheR fusion protein